MGSEKITREEARSTIYNGFGAFPLDDANLLVLSEMGSTSHGTSGHVIDDYDLMGVVLPPARHIVGLGDWQHWVRDPMSGGGDGLDVVLYSVRKWVGLALKANPNVVGIMWTLPEHQLHRSPLWDMIVEERDAFSSKLAYNSFVGYAVSQLQKLEHAAYRGYMGEKRKELVQQFGYDTKNAAHLIRLLRMGTEFLQTGVMNVWREDRDELMQIKRGEWSLEAVKQEAAHMFAAAKDARDASPLPDKPDYDRAERILMHIHAATLEGVPA